jgi:hypothetical protein
MEGAGGGQVTLIFSFIFYLVRLWLGCIPRISFIIACLEVPQKFVWWLVGGGLRANIVESGEICAAEVLEAGAQ